jgi:hypothetical protein
MELLQSKNLKLPTLYFITNREEIKELPIGVPFIHGDESVKDHIIRMLEYEILYQKAIKSGYPFDFKKILEENGYKNLKKFDYSNPTYFECVDTKTSTEKVDLSSAEYLGEGEKFAQYIEDAAVYVDITKLKELNIFPVWLENIEKALTVNIHNFAMFNPNMYNKKLDGMYGGMDFTSPDKNLIIIDISGSIPKGVSSTCLALAKNLMESFYADLLITGTISTLYPYEEVSELDINTIYEVNGMDNDQVYFKELLSKDERRYQTAVVFGDNHTPCQIWNGSGTISREEGKKLCKWEITKLVSLHTNSTTEIAGYADWFEPKEVEKVGNWVKYLK